MIKGFREGFELGYTDPQKVQIKSPNLKIRIGDEIDLWNKVMKEVKLKRFAGPFDDIPFSNYIKSPIGLVPKDNGLDTRLIFHLSYLKNDSKKSVNSNIDPSLCSVVYPEFLDAVQLCMSEGKFCYAARSDMRSAFRNLGISRKFWKFLVMKSQESFHR